MNKIMPYDPCLFCKNSPIKASEEMLNEFIKEFLKCVGQFKKTIKALGYTLEYRQTYLDEFDYGLSCHLDLRDGVRLTRVMERILKDPSYSSKLWTPAFSRLQKMHNVQIALSALQNNGYDVCSGIVINDVVNGHREKIYSLLWQILHKFLAPRYQSSAKKIQIWWRRHYLKIYIKKQILLKKSTVTLQAAVRGFLVRQNIRKLNKNALIIQKWYRNKVGCYKQRKNFILKRNAVIKIQAWYRRILIARADRKFFLSYRSSANIIQRYYRQYILMRFTRRQFLREREAAIKIQNWYRGIILMRKARYQFLLEKKRKLACTKIQKWFRNILEAKGDRKLFLLMKHSAIIIQRHYRRYLLMKRERYEILREREAAIKIQNWYRGILLVKIARDQYISAKKRENAAIKIQQWFRCILKGHEDRKHFLSLKNCANIIKRFYRRYLSMKHVRDQYLRKKESAIKIQNWYRSVALLKKERNHYLLQRRSSILIQRWFREISITKKLRREFLRQKKAAIRLQIGYRHILACRAIRIQFLKQKDAAFKIQKAFRNYKLSKEIRQEYLKLRRSVIVIQQFYRSYIQAKACRQLFLKKKMSAVIIQKWYTNILLFRMERDKFLLMRRSAIVIQRCYRNVVATRFERKMFLLKRQLVIKIQRRFRNLKILRMEQEKARAYKAAVTIQAFYRGYAVRKKIHAILIKKTKRAYKLKASTEGLILSDIMKNALRAFSKKQHIRNLGNLVLAYNDIDLCTRFSPVLCLELSSHEIFFENLWNDLNQGLRHGPHLEIFRHGLNIVLKLAKFPKTVNALIWSMDTFDGYNVIISLMGKFLEKNTEIFCGAATIFWVLLTLTDVKFKVKQKMDLKRLNFFHYKISSRKNLDGKKNAKVIPSQKLDWGYFNIPVVFENVKTASDELQKLLV